MGMRAASRASRASARRASTPRSGPRGRAAPSRRVAAGGRGAGAAGLFAAAAAASAEAEGSGSAVRRVAIFVEPNPFTYVCGYKNRYLNLVRELRAAGDEVLMVTNSTPDPTPEDFHGAKVMTTASFPLPMYNGCRVSLTLSPRIYAALREFRPELVHASSPGVMVFAAAFFARLLRLPLVLAYHTHVPKYIPDYTWSGLVGPAWAVLRALHGGCDLTLVTSSVMRDELVSHEAAPADMCDVWKRGVDSDVFNPKFRSADMRAKLSDGEPERPLIVHVGRLGAEKNLYFLKDILARLPDARLAFIGDGPERAGLEAHFAGTDTVFMGMMTGEALSQAYASGDVFLMPSESETLGFVVLEAMAAGLPVVAVRAGGIPDIIDRDTETGFLYEPGDVEAAAALTRKLLDSPELRKKISTEARDEVERWGWRAATTHLRQTLYRAALENWRKRPSWRKWMYSIASAVITRLSSILGLTPGGKAKVTPAV